MSYEAQFEQAVTGLVADSLADSPTPAQAFEVLENAFAACTRATGRVLALAPPTKPIQCDRGCAWCCSLRVAVTPLEALRIAAYLRDNSDAETLAALPARLAETLAVTQDLTWQEHVRLRLPCPLLHDNACSAHPVRPFACRSHNSLNAKYCEEYARVPTEMLVPMYRPQQDITNGTARGLSAGLTAAGLDGDYRELVSTLLIALATPTPPSAGWPTNPCSDSEAKAIDSTNMLTQLLPRVCFWAEQQEQIIIQSGTPLTAQERQDAAQVGVQHPERVRVLRVAQVPHPEDPKLVAAADAVGLFLAHTAGMALRYGIFLLDDLPDPRTTLAHELAHTAQYERLGGFEGFLQQYLTECITVGYFSSPLERDAVAAAEKIG